jgi:hypothetical protein
MIFSENRYPFFGIMLQGREEPMRKSSIGSAALLALCLGDLSASGAPARATRGADAFAQRAIVACRQMYGGDRGKAGNQGKPIWIENCFRDKTGHYPFELGIPLYPPGYDWYRNPDRY